MNINKKDWEEWKSQYNKYSFSHDVLNHEKIYIISTVMHFIPDDITIDLQIHEANTYVHFEGLGIYLKVKLDGRNLILLSDGKEFKVFYIKYNDFSKFNECVADVYFEDYKSHEKHKDDFEKISQLISAGSWELAQTLHRTIMNEYYSTIEECEAKQPLQPTPSSYYSNHYKYN